MLIDDPHVRSMLHRIVRRLSSEPALCEDLMQVGLVHLWLLEQQRPGQTTSWYLQNSKYHLQNYLAAGRSIDSLKRRCNRVYAGGGEKVLDDLPCNSCLDGEVVQQVCVRDVLSLLGDKVKERDRAILGYLAEGMGAREIARKLGVSHQAIAGHRRKIASLAVKLGIGPLTVNRNGNNGKGRLVKPATTGSKRMHTVRAFGQGRLHRKKAL